MKPLTATVTVEDLKRIRPRQVVDVRSPSEFASGHVPGTVNIPLEQLGSRVQDIDDREPLYLICQSGQRARLAAERVSGSLSECFVVEGGTSAWCAAGFPSVRSVRTSWSLERQVRLAAGVLVLLGTTLGASFDAMWLGLSGFAGLGLTVAGLTDFCPMARALAKAPWNATRQVK